MARGLGYSTAVTTRRDVLTSRSGDALMSLPRVPINGYFQRSLMLEALISGVPLSFFSFVRGAITAPDARERTGA